MRAEKSPSATGSERQSQSSHYIRRNTFRVQILIFVAIWEKVKFRLSSQVNIISNAPQTESGWLNTTKEKRNRYWLLESFTNPSYSALRKFIYQYHLEGMDIMSQSTTKGVAVILSALETLQTMNNTYPGNTGVAIICITKSSEFVNVFSGATTEEKQKASDILRRIDPSNMDKYEKMTK